MARSSALSLLARALSMPPADALRGARRVAVLAFHGARQRLDDLVARGEPVVDDAGWDPFGPDVVLPVRWTTDGVDSVAAEDGVDAPPGSRPGAQPGIAPDARRDSASVAAAAGDALDHRFDLLGSGPVQVDYRLRARGVDGHRYDMAPGPAAEARQLERMQTVLPSLAGKLSDYRPIDWHVDFKSGYRWDPGSWFRSVRYGHRPGVDVKVPWELSRFQHLGALGLAGRLAPETREGEAAAGELVRQVIDWIAANPVRRGVNWTTPMDVALRAIGWLTGLALLPGSVRLHPDFRPLVYRSLVQHGRHIAANLEYAPRRGNHYLADVVGLVAIGAALPDRPESDRWLFWGLQELESEIRRQVRPDGMDFEGSTAYHGLVAELFAVAAAIATRLPERRRRRLADVTPGGFGHPLVPPVRPLDAQPFDLDAPALLSPGLFDRLDAMAELTATVTKADGRIPQIGDVDSGRALVVGPAPDPRDWRVVPAVIGRITDRASGKSGRGGAGIQSRLLVPDPGPAHGRERAGFEPEVAREETTGSSLVVFPAAGLAVARADGLYLAATAGLVAEGGPGGHFHNDLLAFELQWEGVDIVVDPGTFVYTPLPEARDAFRATRAHSTVFVQGREQRLWPPRAAGLFTLREDAAKALLEALGPDALRGSCAYGRVAHEREWRWTSDRIEIVDTVQAPAPAFGVLNLAPGVTPDGDPQRDGEAWTLDLRSDAGTIRLVWSGVARPEIGPGRYSEGYGRSRSCLRLQAELTGPTARLVMERAP